MTKPHDLDELAARVEAATGPDRELDARIEAARRGDDFEHMCRDGYAPADWNAAPFTASLDAAMTLVPEGCAVTLNAMPVGTSVCEINWPSNTVNAWGATPALALTAVCLRVRASLARSLGGG